MNRDMKLQRSSTIDTLSTIEPTKDLPLRRCRTSKEECGSNTVKLVQTGTNATKGANELSKPHHNRKSHSPASRQPRGTIPKRSSLSTSPRRRKAADVRNSQIQQILQLPVAQDLFPSLELEVEHDEKKDDQHCSYLPGQLAVSDDATKHPSSPKRVSGFFLSKMSSFTKRITSNEDTESLLSNSNTKDQLDTSLSSNYSNEASTSTINEESNEGETQTLELDSSSADSMVGMSHETSHRRRQQRQRRDLSKKCASGNAGSLRKLSTL